MGNVAGKLTPCLCTAGAGDISRRHDISVVIPNPNTDSDEGFGHSFCYIKPIQIDMGLNNVVLTDVGQLKEEKTTLPNVTFPIDNNNNNNNNTTFRAISGASVSANTSTALSTALILDSSERASSFSSSSCFVVIPLQPIPRKFFINSGPLPAVQSFGSGPIERRFLSGPIERGSTSSGPLMGMKFDKIKAKYKVNKWKSILNIFLGYNGNFKDRYDYVIDRSNNNESVGKNSCSSVNFSDENYMRRSHSNNNNTDYENVEWAEGKAGEDRVHIVVSQDWVFVGIYDGFNGPDAPDFLVSNLYSNINNELDRVIWTDSSRNTSVLKALSDALSRTEEMYLDVCDRMVEENPELCLMGSCVLGMLLIGEDVYLMNVGDSRAVLGRKSVVDDRDFVDDFGRLMPVQLTVDHNINSKEEVERIRKEHPDDPHALVNDRVKGSLEVTRAFGAGFLKQRKWNDALLEVFRINYISTTPYLTWKPSLIHHKLNNPRDKFLILSSDGLYQYFTNEEAVSEVDLFMLSTPDGDPAQHLIEQVLFRAAKKCGLDFHDLLDIPQGERRKYHDDVSVIVISFQDTIWRSSV